MCFFSSGGGLGSMFALIRVCKKGIPRDKSGDYNGEMVYLIQDDAKKLYPFYTLWEIVFLRVIYYSDSQQSSLLGATQDL